jgi:hypothetical protein
VTAPALPREVLAALRVLVLWDMRGVHEHFEHARRLTAIGAPGPKSGELELACAAVAVRAAERLRTDITRFGAKRWVIAQGAPAKGRRRQTGTRA